MTRAARFRDPEPVAKRSIEQARAAERRHREGIVSTLDRMG
jgi:hypothetical protein